MYTAVPPYGTATIVNIDIHIYRKQHVRTVDGRALTASVYIEYIYIYIQ